MSDTDLGEATTVVSMVVAGLIAGIKVSELIRRILSKSDLAFGFCLLVRMASKQLWRWGGAGWGLKGC